MAEVREIVGLPDSPNGHSEGYAEQQHALARVPGSARDRWAASGLLAFRLPSGFIVSGVLPSMTDLVRRGMVSGRLRQAVMQSAGKRFDDLSEDDIKHNSEQRLRVAAAFVRGLYDDETGEWERLRLTFEDLTDGAIPGDDIEALDTFVVLSDSVGAERAAFAVNYGSERILGLIPDTPPATDENEEAADTEDGWAEFRDESGSGNGDSPGGDVASNAEPDPAPDRPKARVSRRRRTGATPPT